MKYCYVLFVKTGYEQKGAYTLKKALPNSLFNPFVPTKERFFRRNGTTMRILEPCFKSYIFIESDLEPVEFSMVIDPLLYSVNEFFRIMDYGDKAEICMHESERNQLMGLFGEDYCIKGSVGVVEGDQVMVQEGPLKGNESFIQRINRHKRHAIVYGRS